MKTEIEQLEARIKGLNEQAEMLVAKLGPGRHSEALLEGTRMAVEEIEERLAELRAEQA